MIRASFLAGCGLSILGFLAGPLRGQTSAPNDAAVRTLVAGLSSADADTRDRSEGALELLPHEKMAALQKVESEKTLPPDAQSLLDAIVQNSNRRYDVDLKQFKAGIPLFEWCEKTALADYEKDGHTNPNWDAMAQKGIAEAWERGAIIDTNKRNAVMRDAGEQLKAAIAAGCDDPTVLVSAGLVASNQGEDPSKVFEYFAKAAAVATARCPSPYFKIVIDNRVLKQYPFGYHGGATLKTRQEMCSVLDDMSIQYKILAQDPKAPVDGLVQMLDNAIADGQIAMVAPSYVFNCLFPSLEKIAPTDERVLGVKGRCNVTMAWEARGNGYANTVTPQAEALFAQRLATAEDALTKAWQLDPTDPAPPTDMLTVELGQGKSNAVMELWFARAMKANPDNEEACERKLLYLQPKWYGSPREMIAFGRQCLNEGNFFANIPLVLVDAHIALADMSGNPPAYYSQPAVWADINQCYHRYLTRYPWHADKRSWYAFLACNAGKWDIAQKQFDTLGSAVDLAPFGTQARLDQFKALVKAEVNQN
jgi:hypothetical protein